MHRFAGVAADRGFAFGIDWVEGRRVRCYINSSVVYIELTHSYCIAAARSSKYGGAWWLVGRQFVVIAVIRGGRKGVECVRHRIGSRRIAQLSSALRVHAMHGRCAIISKVLLAYSLGVEEGERVEG